MTEFTAAFVVFTAVYLTLAVAAATRVEPDSRPCPDECVQVLPVDYSTFNLQANEVNYFLQFVSVFSPIFSTYETPIQFHRTTTITATLYNLVSAYDQTALDFFGERNSKFLPCCNDNDQKLLDAHRQLSTAFLWLHLGDFFGFPRAFDSIVVGGTGVPLADFNSTTDIATPQGWAKAVADVFFAYTRTDGWNEGGQDTRAHNRMPYEDTTGYCPRRGDSARWRPLKISNGDGAFFEQFHVTPHIGRTGRLFLLSETEFAARQAPQPHYRYPKEIKKLLKRSAALGMDEREQAKVELYDAKFFSMVPLLVQIGLGVPSVRGSILDFAAYVLSIDVAAQEAVTLVWKEKLKFDLVRPPTRLVEELGPDALVRAYAGPGRGTDFVRAAEWQTYIGTMPHSEYPSASACLCQAAIEVGEVANGGTNVSASGPTIVLPMGTSRAQPGLPTTDQVFRYSSTRDIVKDCSSSRLTGGLHFTKSTGAGKKLCQGLGVMSTDRMAMLRAGDPAGKFGDRSDTLPSRRAAPTRPNGFC